MRCRHCGADYVGGRCLVCGSDEFVDVSDMYNTENFALYQHMPPVFHGTPARRAGRVR